MSQDTKEDSIGDYYKQIYASITAAIMKQKYGYLTTILMISVIN